MGGGWWRRGGGEGLGKGGGMFVALLRKGG